MSWAEWYRSQGMCTVMIRKTVHRSVVISPGRYSPTFVDVIVVHCGERLVNGSRPGRHA